MLIYTLYNNLYAAVNCNFYESNSTVPIIKYQNLMLKTSVTKITILSVLRAV